MKTGKEEESPGGGKEVQSEREDNLDRKGLASCAGKLIVFFSACQSDPLPNLLPQCHDRGPVETITVS